MPSSQAVAAGTVGAVGMAGLALGGGYGPLLGRAGLAADTIVGAELVLADGSLVRTDDEQRPELLWALRGGGGNFGVVTALRLRLQPVAGVLAGTIAYAWDQATDVLTGWGELAAEAPDELTVQAGTICRPDASPVVFLNPVWSGRPALVDGGRSRTSPLSAIALHHFHGAATRRTVESTAFGRREPHFMAEIVGSWRPGDGSTDQDWADRVAERLKPYALPGGYPNLLAPGAADQIADAYGPNAARLLEVKRTYDPDGRFAATPLPGGVV